ncbi:RFT1-like protein [Lamellibrachia satsuma]|nr:RFT1-like protein [Lamellibrachia satsuma]
MYYAYFAYIIHMEKVPEDFPFKSFRDLLPRRIPGKPAISWGLANLVWSFLKQSSLKQLLTEGEKYVMTIFDVLSFADQGIYDVISNLGSLAARFIFLPIEDSSYLFFSQTLTRGVTSRKQPKDAVELATQVLEAVLKVVITIGLTFLVFGYAYSYLLLDLYGGSILSSGSGVALLRWYCVFVLLLAVNGITECFAFATMSKEEVDRYNVKMVAFSVLFLASSWYLTRVVGSIGFVLANCLNMLARISHSLHHIHMYYINSGLHPLQGMLLKLPVILTFAAAFVITTYSEKYFCCSHGWTYKCLHIGVGGVCLLVVMTTVLLTERQLVSFIKEQYHKRHKTNEKESKTD